MGFDLQVLKDDRATMPATRPENAFHSITLTLEAPGAEPDCRRWNIVEEEDQASSSDHATIEWRSEGLSVMVDPTWKMRGWARKEKLDKEKEKELLGIGEGVTLAVAWSLN